MDNEVLGIGQVRVWAFKIDFIGKVEMMANPPSVRTTGSLLNGMTYILQNDASDEFCTIRKIGTDSVRVYARFPSFDAARMWLELNHG